jgi:hypothetical protein
MKKRSFLIFTIFLCFSFFFQVSIYAQQTYENQILEDQARQSMLNYYSTKITSHIGYLITITIGLATVLNKNVYEFLNKHAKIYFWTILILYVIGAVYLFGRMCYWSTMTNAIMIVAPYSEADLIRLFPSIFNDTRYKYNQLWAFSKSTTNFVSRIDIYEKEEIRNMPTQIAIWASDWNWKIILSFIVALAFAVNYIYYFAHDPPSCTQ